MYTHTHTHTVYTHTHTLKHYFTHTHSHTCTLTHTHADTHTHTHTHCDTHHPLTQTGREVPGPLEHQRGGREPEGTSDSSPSPSCPQENNPVTLVLQSSKHVLLTAMLLIIQCNKYRWLMEDEEGDEGG